MDMAERLREAEEAFLAIVREGELGEPDQIERAGEEVVFLWRERKLAVVVDCSEAPPEVPDRVGVGGWGQA